MARCGLRVCQCPDSESAHGPSCRPVRIIVLKRERTVKSNTHLLQLAGARGDPRLAETCRRPGVCRSSGPVADAIVKRARTRRHPASLGRVTLHHSAVRVAGNMIAECVGHVVNAHAPDRARQCSFRRKGTPIIATLHTICRRHRQDCNED